MVRSFAFEGRMGRVAAVYFHGSPGGPDELGLFADVAVTAGLDLFAPDRTHDRPALGCAAYFDALASDIVARFPQGGVRLIGFSLGGYVALEVARRLGPRVASIELISAAAPLECGDFLPSMAGRAVFKTALRRPWAFGALTSIQGLMARWVPGRLFQMIFASCRGGDAALAGDAVFRERMQRILLHCLAGGAAGYRRDVAGYVKPWGGNLAGIAVPVRLWHGTADNWAPFAMAEALQARLAGTAGIEALEGASHYSALRVALQRIATEVLV